MGLFESFFKRTPQKPPAPALEKQEKAKQNYENFKAFANAFISPVNRLAANSPNKALIEEEVVIFLKNVSDADPGPGNLKPDTIDKIKESASKIFQLLTNKDLVEESQKQSSVSLDDTVYTDGDISQLYTSAEVLLSYLKRL